MNAGLSFIPVEAPKYESTEWQEEDLAHLVEREWSANWSEMGCYKTTTGLWLAERRIKGLGSIDFTPCLLIVTSRAGKGTYYDAIPKTLAPQGWRTFDVNVNGVHEREHELITGKWEIGDFYEMRKEIKQPHIILAHYHCFTNKNPSRQWLQRIPYTFIILDEAHRIKNKDGQWTRHIKRLSSIGGKHVMTGTGFVNRPDEIWSLLHFLDKEQFSSYGDFRDRYVLEEDMPNGYKAILGLNEKNKEEFRQLVREVGPRREMRKVHSDIQEPIIVTRDVDLNTTQRTMYDNIKRDLYMLDQKGESIESANVLSLLNRLRQICVATPELVRDYYDPIMERRVQEVKLVEPSSKLDEFMDLLQELRWDDEVKNKVVVFSQFKDPLRLLEARLKTSKVSYLHMQVNHNDEQRYKMWHDDFAGPDYQVFLSTLDLGGESINLTPAQYCVFLDRSWSPRANNQAIGRVYRPGQTEAVELIYINARRTTDQRIAGINAIKTGWFMEIFGDDVPEGV
jgi:SNF2 family DNA or RNA helicase